MWNEYNCRHTYFGIILGVSEPIYTDKELKVFKNATVNWNGKKISYYEATQKQRQLENAIRKQKRTVQTLEKANMDNKVEKGQLAQLQRKYKDFCKETGLEKDYQRLQVAKISDTTLKQESNYKDITSNFVKAKKYKVKEQQYYEDEEGNKYKVDGKNVVLEPTKREKEVANILGKMYGGQVRIIPRVNEPPNIKTPDYIVNNEKFDLKEITGSGKYAIEGNLRKKKKQANNFIIDLTNSKIDFKEAERQIESIYRSKRYLWVDKIVIIKENTIIKIYQRK